MKILSLISDIDNIDKNTPLSRIKYKVEKDNGDIVRMTAKDLIGESIDNAKRFDYIDRFCNRYETADGFNYCILAQVKFSKKSTDCEYLIEYEDGEKVICKIPYGTKLHRFSRDVTYYTISGESYHIINTLETVRRTSRVCEIAFLVKFDANDIYKIYSKDTILGINSSEDLIGSIVIVDKFENYSDVLNNLEGNIDEELYFSLGYIVEAASSYIKVRFDSKSYLYFSDDLNYSYQYKCFFSNRTSVHPRVKDLVDREFEGKNEKYKVVGAVGLDYNSVVSDYTRLIVKFDNGFKKTITYYSFVNNINGIGEKGGVISVDYKSEIPSPYYKCKCSKCKLTYIMTYEEALEHDISHWSGSADYSSALTLDDINYFHQLKNKVLSIEDTSKDDEILEIVDDIRNHYKVQNSMGVDNIEN